MVTGRAAALACALLLLSAPARAERSAAYDTATTALLIAVPVGLLAWDGYLAVRYARTESMLLRDAAWRSSALPYAIGFVCGHWFLNLQESREKYIVVGLASVGAVALLDVLVHSDGRPAWKHPGLWFGLGVAGGALTWAQRF